MFKFIYGYNSITSFSAQYNSRAFYTLNAKREIIAFVEKDIGNYIRTISILIAGLIFIVLIKERINSIQ